MISEFYIVIDANVMKDYVESPLGCYQDQTHKKHVINAGKLFNKLKSNIKICLDGNKNDSKILYEYKKQIGKKNKILFQQFVVQLSQDRIRFINHGKLNKLNSYEKKKILQKNFDKDDLIYLYVANSIQNTRFIITRDRGFYDPKNPKKIGDYNSIMAKYLKQFKINVRIAKDAINEKEICI